MITTILKNTKLSWHRNKVKVIDYWYKTDEILLWLVEHGISDNYDHYWTVVHGNDIDFCFQDRELAVKFKLRFG